MSAIPQLIAVGEVLPEAWEKSLFLLKEHGIRSRKESYSHASGVDEILEASMKMVVKNPLKEPMLHRGCEGLSTLEEYVDEVLKGTKDAHVGKGWDYTYHQRLFAYKGQGAPIDQIHLIAEKLSKTPFSNRAQAVTWVAQTDAKVEGPPCLQRVWCKIVDDQYLELHTSWRSREAYIAAFMNMYAMVNLQKSIAEKLHVKVGQYVDDSDSYHIYAENFDEFESMLQTVLGQKSKGRTPWENSSILRLFRKTKNT